MPAEPRGTWDRYGSTVGFGVTGTGGAGVGVFGSLGTEVGGGGNVGVERITNGVVGAVVGSRVALGALAVRVPKTWLMIAASVALTFALSVALAWPVGCGLAPGAKGVAGAHDAKSIADSTSKHRYRLRTLRNECKAELTLAQVESKSKPSLPGQSITRMD